MKRAILFLSSLIVLFFLAPTIISTSLGVRFLNYTLSNREQKIAIENLSLSWFKGQKAQNILIKKNEKGFVFSCPEITCSAPLFKILGKDLGDIHLKSPKLISIESKKSISIATCGISPLSISLDFPLYRFKYNAFIENAKFYAEEKPFFIDSIFINLKSQEQIISIKASANTNIGEHIGEITLAGSLEDDKIQLNANLLKAPTLAISELLKLANISPALPLEELLGKTIDLNLNTDLSTASLRILSENLNANLLFSINHDSIKLFSPTKLTLTITPEFIAKTYPDLKLKTSSALNLELNNLYLPLNGLNPDLKSVVANFNFYLENVDLLLKEKPITLSTLIAQASLDKILELNVQAKAFYIESLCEIAINTKDFSKIQANIKNLPLIPIDALFESSLVDILGETVSASLLLEGNNLTASLNSQALTLPQLEFICDQGFILKQPATLTYTPIYLGNITPPIEIKLNSLSLDKDFYPTSLKADLNANLNQLLKVDVGAEKCSLKAEIENRTFKIKSEEGYPEINIEGRLGKKASDIAFTKPLEFKLILSKEQLEGLFSIFNISHKFNDPSKISIAIDPFSLDKRNIKGTLDIDKLYPFKDLKSYFELSKQDLGIISSGVCINEDESIGKLNIDSKLSLKNFAVNGKVTLNNLSISVIEDLLGLNWGLGEALGSHLNLDLKGTLNKDKKNLSALIKSKNLDADISFISSDKEFYLTRPSHVFISLNEDGIHFLENKSDFPFLIKEMGKLSFEATNFSCKNIDLQSFWDSLITDANLSLTSLSLIDKASKQSSTAKDITIKLSKNSSKSPLQINASASTIAGLEGDFSLNSNLDLAFEKTSINFDKSTIDFTCNAKHFPCLILDIFTPKNRLFTSLFGDRIQINANSSLKNGEGPIKTNVYSALFRTNLDGYLENSVLKLSEPLQIQFILSTAIKKLVPKLAPFSSTTPITFSTQSLSLPLKDIKQVSLNNSSLDLGKILCKPQGSLESLLKVLKILQFYSKNDLSLWFATANTQIKDKILNLQRTEILIADSLEVALWGTMNLETNQVNMTLGLTKQCLQKAFGITNLPDNYMLHIPITGIIDNISLDSETALKKISILLALKSSTQLFKAPFLDMLSGSSLPDLDSPAPPPKHPFPWEKSKNHKASFSPPKKEPTEKMDLLEPLKNLFKIVK